MDERILREFATAVAGRDHEVDLFGGEIAIARLRSLAVEEHVVSRELDLIAEDVRLQAGDAAGLGELASAIDHVLFTVRGFHGNRQNMNDAANSYLDQVLYRRTGLPITLSLVYMEVAARVGLPCDGVGYPGHFIVRYGDEDAPVYVDPFHQGARLDRGELLAGLRNQELGNARPESFLSAVTRRQILQRMLNNLRGSYRLSGDIERWLGAIELQLVIEPWNSSLVGERGLVQYRLGNNEAALGDLERYVDAASPEGVSAGARRLLNELRLRYRDEGFSA